MNFDTFQILLLNQRWAAFNEVCAAVKRPPSEKAALKPASHVKPGGKLSTHL
jgi:hypothetical protein